MNPKWTWNPITLVDLGMEIRDPTQTDPFKSTVTPWRVIHDQQHSSN